GAVEHRTVRRRATAKMMTLDKAGKSAPLACADHIHNVFWLELFRQNAIALLQIVRSLAEMELAKKLHTLGARFRQVLRDRLVLLLRVFDEPKLNGVIAVSRRGFSLRNDAGTRLDESDRNDLPFLSKHLRHANLFPKNSWTHVPPVLISCRRL